MKKALIVTLHEIRIYFQDKADLMFSLFLPIAVFTLMYFGFSGDSMFNGTAHIVNNDEGGYYSTELLERLGNLENITVKLYSQEDAEIRLERSDILTVLIIPEEFSEKLLAGESTQLLFKQRGNGGQEGQIILSIISSVAGDINRELQAYNTVTGVLKNAEISQTNIDTIVKKYLDQESESPVVQISEKTVGSSPDMVNQFLPGVVNMFVLFAVTLSARMIVEERRKGTLERLLTTRLSISQLFFGKFLASMSRGFIQTVILLILGYAVFQIFTPLSFLECLIVALVFAAAASSLGLVIAAIARSEDAATWIAVFLTMAMVMLGGTFFEIPDGTILHLLSRFSIITYANEAFRTIIAEGGSITDLGMQLGILIGVFVAGFILSRFLFRILPGGR
jgi:ABC-2 type transport system permease protein